MTTTIRELEQLPEGTTRRLRELWRRAIGLHAYQLAELADAQIATYGTGGAWGGLHRQVLARARQGGRLSELSHVGHLTGRLAERLAADGQRTALSQALFGEASARLVEDYVPADDLAELRYAWTHHGPDAELRHRYHPGGGRVSAAKLLG
jgi:hypothetical protein